MLSADDIWADTELYAKLNEQLKQTDVSSSSQQWPSFNWHNSQKISISTGHTTFANIVVVRLANGFSAFYWTCAELAHYRLYSKKKHCRLRSCRWAVENTQTTRSFAQSARTCVLSSGMIGTHYFSSPRSLFSYVITMMWRSSLRLYVVLARVLREFLMKCYRLVTFAFATESYCVFVSGTFSIVSAAFLCRPTFCHCCKIAKLSFFYLISTIRCFVSTKM